MGSVPDRTVVVDGVRLTEAQVRAAVKALEASPPPPPPPLLTRADIKPGEFYRYIGMWDDVYMAIVPNAHILSGAICGVSAWGNVLRSSVECEVTRRTSFTDTGGA